MSSKIQNQDSGSVAKSYETLSYPKGQVTHGLVASGVVALVMQPFFKWQTDAMNGVKLGFKNLYRGFVPNFFGVVPGTGASFVAKSVIQEAFLKDQDLTRVQKLGVAMLPGALTAGVPTAFDRVMIVEQTHKVSTREALSQILKHDGVKGFTKGLTPAIVRESLFTGSLFGVSDEVADRLTHLVPNEWVRMILANSVTGAFAGVVSLPANVVKTKMQASLTGFYSVSETVSAIFKKEGWKGFLDAKKAMARGTLTAGAMITLGFARKLLPPLYSDSLHR